jgi:hypothetical protein
MLLVIFLETLIFIILFLLKIFIFYYLIKLFKKDIASSAVIKPILIYELGVFIFYLLYPSFGGRITILYLLIPLVVLYLFFYSIVRKSLLLDWKKSLAIFPLAFLLIGPILSYTSSLISSNVTFPMLAKKKPEIFQISLLNLLNLEAALPLPLRIINQLKKSAFSERFFGDFQQYIVTRY